jgi:preprotein translocase subunit SecA/nephrocystin-3
VALDLRWGINEEAAKSGKVVEICMDEIVRSRPFFIGLLGGRYGTIPKDGDDSITEKLLNKYPWIRDCVNDGLSITEMEMQFGVLNNPEPVNAYFFQKNEAFIPRRFREKPGTEQTEKLDALKTAVKSAAEDGKCSLMSYTSLKSLGQQVHDVLISKIEEDYPEKENSRYGLLSRRQHEFLKKLRNVYVRYKDDSKLSGNILVCGSGGSGKSAFVANRGANGMEPDAYLVYTVVNNEVNSPEQCKRLFLYELSQQVRGIDISKIDQPLETEIDLKGILDKSGFDGKVRWVIDGMDDFVFENDIAGVWLNDLPSQIYEVMLTVTDASRLNSSVRKRFQLHEIDALNPGEILEITHEYLKDFSKYLSDSQEFHISNATIAAMPETLMVFLKELVQFGFHDKLDDFLNNYLREETIEGFYAKILKRLEEDFGSDRIRMLFESLILCPYGLPEEGLQKLLGVKNIDWVAIYDAVSPFVAVNCGYIRLDDKAMSAAVRQVYDIDAGRYSKLIRILEKENRSIVKQEVDRAIDVENETDTRQLRRLRFILPSMLPYCFSYDPVVSDRYCSNVMSIIHIYRAAGKPGMVARVIRDNYFMLLSHAKYDSLNVVNEVLSKNYLHISDLFTFRMLLFERMLGEESPSFVSVSLLNSFNLGEQKKEDIDRLCNKIRRMPLKRSVKYKLCLEIRKEEVKFNSLEEIFDRADWEQYIQQIMKMLMTLFYIDDKDVFRRLVEKVSAASQSVELGDIRLFVLAAACMRIRDPRADGYMEDFLNSSIIDMFKKSDFFDCYVNIYYLFDAAVKGDFDTISKLVEKVKRYEHSDVYIYRYCFYLINAVSVVVLGDADIYSMPFDEWNNHKKRETEKLISLLDKYAGVKGSESAGDNLFNIAKILYNLERYESACVAYEKSAECYADNEVVNKISAYMQMGYSADHSGSSLTAERAFSKAFDLRLGNLDAKGYSLYRIYSKLEMMKRRSGKYLEALSLSSEVLEVCKNSLSDTDRKHIYNKMGMNMHCLLMDKVELQAEQKVKCFLEGFAAYTEAISLCESDQDRAALIVNRSRLALTARGVSAADSDNRLAELEELLEQTSDKELTNDICETLAEWYMAEENWSGIKKLQENYGVFTRVARENEFHVIYHAASDKDAALGVIAERMLTATFKQNNRNLKTRQFEEIKGMEILDSFVELLERKFEENTSDSVLFAALMRELGIAFSESSVVSRGEVLISSFMRDENNMFSHYPKLKKLLPLDDILLRNGWSSGEVNDMLAEISYKRFVAGDVMCDDAFENVLRSPDAIRLMSGMFEAAVVQVKSSPEISDHERAHLLIAQVVLPVYDCMDAVAQLLTMQNDYKRRFIDMFDTLLSMCTNVEYYEDASWPGMIYAIRQAFGLPCDVRLIWQLMLMENDLNAKVQLWNEFPECHSYVRCQSEYVYALRLLRRDDEAERELMTFLETSGDDEGKSLLELQYILMLRGKGLYAEMTAWLEANASEMEAPIYKFNYAISLAYAGRPAEALRILERSWVDEQAYYYLKSVCLLMQGLYEDSEKNADAAESMGNSELHLTKMLYMIQKARYWKDSGEMGKAKEQMSEIRARMRERYFDRMCEYEADQLGLD